ncbi:diaminopimelate decarboxylase family protein [Limibacillus halophilus]|uniref:Diaminopimelate decarboxylase n=1 Tax=Limibacillus halophilus TaxID=1579333 RepID=A0A839SR88_9PROT|nr:hypothetical protein [Limibacillus halophilus]MBB3064334.1 diaminopimelate decarboxylase [Limibacillus halophilus]
MNGAETLARERIFSDRLTVDAKGMLCIGGASVGDLLQRFGSPLVVGVEETLLANFERIRDAFGTAWPGPSAILYSTKSNDTLAFRHLLSRAGAGGDCFGEGELRSTLDSGADPSRVALNGSDKTAELIDLALVHGVTINIDAADEVDLIVAAIARTGSSARVNIRLKVLPDELGPYMGGSTQRHGQGIASVRRAKWGLGPDAAQQIAARLQQTQGLELTGFSVHIGHLSNRPEAFASIATAFGATVRKICEKLDLRPSILDLGGGWAREREPEQRGVPIERVTVETQVKAACDALASALGPLADPVEGPVPELWVEPGRYICGNAQVLLATVGSVKEDCGFRWVNVDISTNNLMRIETGAFEYQTLPASRMHDLFTTAQEIVGRTCFRSVVGAGRLLPKLVRGDLVAILDAGMYAEVFATQFNSMPRPAAVLVGAKGEIELVRVRETLADVFAHHRVPGRLKWPEKE